MGLLDGKVALVTGAAQGIGRAISVTYAQEGAQVAAVDLDEVGNAETAALVEDVGGKCIAIRCDVGVRSDIDAAVTATVEAFGGLDVLVNAAIAGAPTVPLLDTSEQLVESMWRTGPLATLFFLQSCHPHLRKDGGKGGGAVINFGSIAGMDGDIGFAAYGPAKEGVRSLTKIAAREFGRDGIRVNAICPSAKTRLMEQWIKEHPNGAAQKTKMIPLGRFGEPEEIARTAVYLASDLSSYVTGHTMMVDGGSCRF